MILYGVDLFPPARFISQSHADRPHAPVDHHSDPHAEHAQPEPSAEQIAENDAEDPHGSQRDHHRHLRVPGRPEGRGNCERHRPDKACAHAVEVQDAARCLRGNVRQVVRPEHKRHHTQYDEIDDPHAQVDQPDQLFGKMLRLLMISRAHAPRDDRCDRQVDRHARQHLKIRHCIADRIRCDRVCTEGGHQAEHDDLPKLEHRVLKAVGDPDPQDPLHHRPVRPETECFFYTDHIFSPAEHEKDQHSRRNAGYQRRDGDAFRPPAEAIDQDGIPRDIHRIHDHRHLHGDFRIPHRAEYGRARIVQRDKRDGCRNDHQIGIRVSHDIRVDLSEYHMQDKPFPAVYDCHDHYGQDRSEPDQLCRRAGGKFSVFLPEILSGYDRAPGGEGCEEIGKQHHDIVYQRDSRHSSLPHARYHHRVRHAYKDSQELLHDQRQDQRRQSPVCKKKPFFFYDLFFPHTAHPSSLSCTHYTSRCPDTQGTIFTVCIADFTDIYYIFPVFIVSAK